MIAKLLYFFFFSQVLNSIFLYHRLGNQSLLYSVLLVITGVLIFKNKLSISDIVIKLMQILFLYTVLSAIFDISIEKFNIEIKTIQMFYSRLISLIISVGISSLTFESVSFYFQPTLKSIVNFIDMFFIRKEKVIKEEVLSNIRSLADIDNLGNNGLAFEDEISNIFKQIDGVTSYTTRELRNNKNLPSSIMKRGGSGEQGVDVVVFFDEPKNIHGENIDGILIQAKHYSNKVSNKAIQEIYTARPMYEQHFNRKFHTMAITNNYFTGSAMDLAKSTNVSLIDRTKILDFINKAKYLIS